MAWFRKPQKYMTLPQNSLRNRIPEGMWIKCPDCTAIVTTKEFEDRQKVCPRCGHHEKITARERIGWLIDEGTFEEFDGNLVSGDPLKFVDSKPYPDRIKEARRKTGERDAVISGIGRVLGRPLSLAVMDFNFNGGSMGSVVGEKITRSIERGIEMNLPVLTVCASGGARMQEGMLSLMQLAKTSAAIARLGQARLPYFVLLTHPSTAGAMASFASLGDVTFAEPGALIGFAGPRVIEATIKQVLPPGFQKPEFVLEHGFVDLIVPRYEFRESLATLIGLLGPAAAAAGQAKVETVAAARNTAGVA